MIHFLCGTLSPLGKTPKRLEYIGDIVELGTELEPKILLESKSWLLGAIGSEKLKRQINRMNRQLKDLIGQGADRITDPNVQKITIDFADIGLPAGAVAEVQKQVQNYVTNTLGKGTKIICVVGIP